MAGFECKSDLLSAEAFLDLPVEAGYSSEILPQVVFVG